jgi:sec-independent protein translocase protein TatB
MFDIGLSELALILVVAVLVIGPDQMPEVARKVSGWVRRARYYTHQIRDQFDLLDESGEIKKLREELQEQAKYIRDEEGKLYRTYDISDFIETNKTDDPT